MLTCIRRRFMYLRTFNLLPTVYQAAYFLIQPRKFNTGDFSSVVVNEKILMHILANCDVAEMEKETSWWCKIARELTAFFPECATTSKCRLFSF